MVVTYVTGVYKGNVVQRKIIGGLRREKGARIMETIMTMITTWKQRGLALLPTMKYYLIDG